MRAVGAERMMQQSQVPAGRIYNVSNVSVESVCVFLGYRSAGPWARVGLGEGSGPWSEGLGLGRASVDKSWTCFQGLQPACL